MRRAILLAAVAALVLVGFVPAAGADPASRPLQAILTGALTFVPDSTCPPFGLRTDWAATGTASHLGLTTVTGKHCTHGAYEVFEGTGAFVAANGDEVFVEYQGDGPLPPPGSEGQVHEVDMAFQIVGGSGRLERAVGGGDLTLYVVFEGFGVPVWPGTLVWEGTIGY
jgi:hypothetical protein